MLGNGKWTHRLELTLFVLVNPINVVLITCNVEYLRVKEDGEDCIQPEILVRVFTRFTRTSF